ncbi:hypothetical protein KNU02_gp78 [Gordonia phage Pleakley]|uniref:Uncharacterized protein n=1 Tax=Gordonia phage Pleakley TaxID=2283246 RepID=A0A345M6J6_9CAUD|nr:hypothetical protein KNU02_gp78 [Gordonia phage Pleakley]AXH49803.1 hypothetical protein SEA_FURY_78 [Gordonia phage Fury]AXH66117.1 hypothetical protein SEA_PLEAKLEY_78 [Gordonia phage Pleakley]
MNRAERRATQRLRRTCKHKNTVVKHMMTKPAVENGEPAGTVSIGYRVCLDCGAENKTPVRMS